MRDLGNLPSTSILKSNKLLDLIVIHKDCFNYLKEINTEIKKPILEGYAPESLSEITYDKVTKLLALGISVFAIGLYYSVRVFDTLYCKKGALQLIKLIGNCKSNEDAEKILIEMRGKN